jgi:hypothetical protein
LGRQAVLQRSLKLSMRLYNGLAAAARAGLYSSLVWAAAQQLPLLT